jgi:hypothetical protein
VVVLNVIGAVAIVGGWLWASGRTVLEDQYPATALTVGGLVVAGLGNLAWLLAARRSMAVVKRTLFASGA